MVGKIIAANSVWSSFLFKVSTIHSTCDLIPTALRSSFLTEREKIYIPKNDVFQSPLYASKLKSYGLKRGMA